MSNPVSRNLLRKPAVQDVLGVKRSTLDNLVKAGLLTRPVAIGERAIGWPSDEISKIVDARVAGFTNAQLRDLIIKLEAARVAHYV